MRYYDAKRDANLPTLDHYTGVGEVLAVHSLDTVDWQATYRSRSERLQIASWRQI